MWKNEGKSKSVKKPLRDISNRRIGSSKSTKKTKATSDQDDRIGSGNALDRLLLVHSDVSNLFRQIDELVVQVVKAEEIDRQGRKEIESITCVLSEILSSLKPWVPRLQKAFSAPSMESKKQSVASLGRGISTAANAGDDPSVLSPEPTKKESLVSPSPLVSWRATGCTVEMGKQLFALTPLPRPKTAIAKGQASSKSVALQRVTSSSAAIFPSCFSNAHNTANGKREGLLKNQPSEDSPTHVAKKIKTNSVVGRASPKFLKMSPIRSFSNRNFDKVYKSTPFPLGKQMLNELTDDESSGSEVPQSMGLKYSRSVLNPVYSASKGKKTLDLSPEWLMSPPKTCTLMDPFDDKPLRDDEPLCDKPLKDDVLSEEFEILSGAFKQYMTLATSKQDDVESKSKPSWNPTNNLVSCGSNLAFVEMTPMWKEPQSTAYKGKRPGENTLKRELWVRFEAASTDGLNLNLMFPRETERNGFLDKLEEAS